KTVVKKLKARPGGTRTAGKRAATQPTAQDIAARVAVARDLFNPVAATAARNAFLHRQQPRKHAS
ncbi:MAG TPA: hypothetical protein VH370_12615, partial [Humisphaera sp.]|nr:hypothetical protein [Humisphaera sp.]